METQDGDPELQPNIRDIDYTQGQIDILLVSQTNDRERYTVTEKIILELVNKSERLLKERKELLETLENQLETVEEYPGDNNIKKTSVFIHTPDTKTTRRHFEYIEIEKCSDLQTSQFYNARVVTNYKDMRKTIQ